MNVMNNTVCFYITSRHCFTRVHELIVIKTALTFADGQLNVLCAQDRAPPEVLKGAGGPRAGVMVRAITPLLTALDGCSKALTICTML